jgi:phosphoribosyl-dephospho-CoA transferase
MCLTLFRPPDIDVISASLAKLSRRQQFGHLPECLNVAQSGRIEVIARMSALRGEADLA